MNIGQVAKASGVSAKMIRHYEAGGVIQSPARGSSGYRQYGEKDVRRLNFVRRARAIGFSAQEIKRLVSLWEDRARPARDVKALAEAHLAEIDRRIQELMRISAALSHLIAHCQGDEHPECAILESLEGAMEGAEPLPAGTAASARRRLGKGERPPEATPRSR